MKYSQFLRVLLLSGIIFTHLHADVAEEDYFRDPKNMLDRTYQSRIRSYLKAVQASHEIREKKKKDTLYFFLPQEISKSLDSQNILEVGCGPGASIRAFKGKGTQVNVVEPDAQALALAFDPEWTRKRDEETKGWVESTTSYTKQMNLDTEWAMHPLLCREWIGEHVNIYLSTVQNLPIEFNRSFSLIVYKDFNIGEERESFFRRLSTLLVPEGMALIQFFGNEFEENPSLKGMIDRFFKSSEWILDPREYKIQHKEGNIEFVKDEKRILILKKPFS